MSRIRKVILDTDIGDDIDDSFALMLLLESKKFNVLGVTTVFRNSLKRAKMAKQLIEALGYDTKVYAGIDEPLKVKVDSLISKEIKEKEKVDEDGKYLIPQWDESMKDYKVEEENAVDFIIEEIHKYPHQVTLIPIGPMTNIASAIKKDPSIVPLIREIRFMGCGIGLGFVEWNDFCDPDAMKIVLNSGADKIVAVTFNATSKTGLNKEEVDALKNSDSKAVKLIYKAMIKWMDHYNFVTPVMHDPLTVASLIDQKCIKKIPLGLDVDLSRKGMTYINNNKSNKILVALDVNKDAFMDVFKNILKI